MFKVLSKKMLCHATFAAAAVATAAAAAAVTGQWFCLRFLRDQLSLCLRSINPAAAFTKEV